MDWLFISLGVITGITTAFLLKHNIKLEFSIDNPIFKIIESDYYGKNLSYYEKMILSETVNEMAEKHNINYLLLMAIIQQESNFRPDLPGTLDEKGIMQIRPIAYREVLRVFPEIKINWDQMWNIKENIIVGSHYFKHCMNRAGGDLKHIIPDHTLEERALMFYNGGWSFNQRALEYSKEVLDRIPKFKKLIY